MSYRVSKTVPLFAAAVFLMAGSLHAAAAEVCGSYDDCMTNYYLLASGVTPSSVAVSVGVAIGGGVYAVCDGTGFRRFKGQPEGVFKSTGDTCGRLFVVLGRGQQPLDYGLGECPSTIANNYPELNKKCGKEH